MPARPRRTAFLRKGSGLTKSDIPRKKADQFTYLLHGLAILLLGFALTPMVLFIRWTWRLTASAHEAERALVFSFSLAAGYFIFGASLLLCCVAARHLFRFKCVPGRHSLYSKEALKWMGYNLLILVANSAFLDVLRLSPFQTLFYRLMGARLGAGVRINTGGLADLEMLEIGDGAVIGGGVALICHALAREVLYLEPTRIGKWAAIGMGSVIMPGCQVGDGAVIPPLSYLPPGTQVPPKGRWGRAEGPPAL